MERAYVCVRVCDACTRRGRERIYHPCSFDRCIINRPPLSDVN